MGQSRSDAEASDGPGGSGAPAVASGRGGFRLITRGAAIRLSVLLGALGIGGTVGGLYAIDMPGACHTGPLPPLTADQAETAGRLRADVEVLAGEHRGRSTFNPLRYAAAQRFIAGRLAGAGLDVREEVFTTAEGHACANIIAELAGTTRRAEIVVVGAHYDACGGQPGADDNASGVAGVLELAARFAGRAAGGRPPAASIRFIAFANEEPPYFATEDMGSHRHARAASARGERIVAMLSLEMLGFYSDDPAMQRYPPPVGLFYPKRADTIVFVSNMRSGPLLRRAVGVFRESIDFPSLGGALPESVPGVGFSDHRSFWAFGFPAIMVTDTAMYRNPHYHMDSDRPDTLDYGRMARVVDGLDAVVADLAG